MGIQDFWWMQQYATVDAFRAAMKLNIMWLRTKI